MKWFGMKRRNATFLFIFIFVIYIFTPSGNHPTSKYIIISMVNDALNNQRDIKL